MQFDVKSLKWHSKPEKFQIGEDKIVISTEPGSDFWQRTYYGFQNDNAHALMLRTDEKFFSFIVKTQFDSKKMYDQCGVVIYQNSDNWMKASIEFENDRFQRLGSVVTNNGFSDWASTDISTSVKEMYYRLSRRESDYCIENSEDGVNFKQMRIFHMFEGSESINFGFYACSPGESSFEAIFTEFKMLSCQWELH